MQTYSGNLSNFADAADGPKAAIAADLNKRAGC